MPSRLAVITYLGPEQPDNSLPGVPVYPGNALPGFPGRPDNSLPGLPPGAVQLPVFPFDPTRPDQSLPGPQPTPTPPIQIVPGARFVVKWLACVGLILVPDNTLPPTPEPK